jgi:hypothetical protein
LAAFGEEGQFDGGEREFIAQLGIGAAQFAGDAIEGGVDCQACLGADDEQIERIGQAFADRVGALFDEVAHIDVGAFIACADSCGKTHEFFEVSPLRKIV